VIRVRLITNNDDGDIVAFEAEDRSAVEVLISTLSSIVDMIERKDGIDAEITVDPKQEDLPNRTYAEAIDGGYESREERNYSLLVKVFEHTLNHFVGDIKSLGPDAHDITYDAAWDEMRNPLLNLIENR